MLERSLSATGGNIPVPSYYTGLGIHLPADTKDNGSTHSSDFLSLEKRLPNFPTTASFDSIVPSSQQSLSLQLEFSQSDILSLIVAVIGLPLAVFGACFLYWYNNNYHTFWTWSCDNRKIDHPEAQFKVVCGEIGFAFSMSWLVAAAESLMIINVIVGCIVVKRKNGETRLGV
ncbi:uncharacterized protein H6S33_012046 [Morchella sextelata]|uniref:uncharacterized protein n=1 Tax=Morchella sextelata TaxID=1174677 RepID=UPI001D036264|nr:uncharacterized protein H6S33_012046 [Morchella sextelata]KAH0610519.1 hypothetical protein H6S33_012046 [Morchella sextelata]